MSEAWYTFMDVDFPWKMKHSTIPCGFACTTVIPYLPRTLYLIIYIYLFLRARTLLGACYTLLDVGLPRKMKHSTIPYGFPCTTAIPHTYQIDLYLIIYIFICFFMGENLACGVLHVAGRGLSFIGLKPCFLFRVIGNVPCAVLM